MGRNSRNILDNEIFFSSLMSTYQYLISLPPPPPPNPFLGDVYIYNEKNVVQRATRYNAFGVHKHFTALGQERANMGVCERKRAATSQSFGAQTFYSILAKTGHNGRI